MHATCIKSTYSGTVKVENSFHIDYYVCALYVLTIKQSEMQFESASPLAALSVLALKIESEN